MLTDAEKKSIRELSEYVAHQAKKAAIKEDLLDIYATSALIGILANSHAQTRATPDQIAEDSFAYAVAMLKQRDKILKGIK